MKTWLLANWRPLAAIALLLVLYLLAWLAPMAKDTRELLIAIGNVLGLFGVGIVPNFARIHEDE